MRNDVLTEDAGEAVTSPKQCLIVTKERLLMDLWCSAWNTKELRVAWCASILVADDQEAARSIGQFLQDRGHTAVAASDGKEALRFIDSDPSVELALLDLDMPEMGGMEVLADLMIRRVRPGVVVLSGVTDRQIAQQALKLGAFALIMKRFNLENCYEYELPNCSVLEAQQL